MEPWMLQALILGLIGLIGYFLRQKDTEQAKSIAILFHKHDEDALKLQQLELRIANEHYIKPELDSKFDKLDNTIKSMSDSLGHKFDKLSDILIAHLVKEEGKHNGN